MAPKRRGRPRKADKPAEDKVEDNNQTAALSEPADVPEDVVEEEEEADKPVAEPSPKKPKVEEKKKRGRQPKAAAAKKTAASVKTAVDDEVKDEEEAEEGVEEEAAAKSEKVVIIEASKECNCFKTRATKVQTGLSEAFPGIQVLINPDKPRKGCFEVRSKDGDIYLSMLGLPRPFTKLKNLDMDKAVDEIVAKVK